MNLSEKIMKERKKLGMSQNQLADTLGITRQSVSKWEAGTSIPELSKLIALSELFQVSLDYLLKDYITEDSKPDIASYGNYSFQTEENKRIEEKVDDLAKYIRGYQYTSKTKVAGIPLVSIRFSRRLGKDSVAKGIIAIGNVAIGVISLGAISVGVISFGAIAFGILAVAAWAVGVAAWGAFAIGIAAFGTTALGIYSAGVAAYGKEIAVGVSAAGKTVIGETVSGTNCLIWHEGITALEIENFLNANCPNLWRPLKELLVVFSTHIS